MTDILPAACRSCPAYNNSVPGEMGDWCVDQNKKVIDAIRLCNPVQTKAQWAEVLATRVPGKKKAA